MGALDETLAALSSRLPELAPAMASLAQESERLEKAVQELLGDFEEKRVAAEALEERARAAVAGLTRANTRQTEKLEAAVHALEAAIDRFRHGLRTAEEALLAEARSAGGAMDTLTGQLTAAGRRTREAHDAGAAAAGELGGALQTGLTDLQGAFDAANDQAAALDHALAEAQASLEGDLSGLSGTMATLREEARTAVAGALGGCRARQAAHERKLQDAADDLAAGKASLLGDLRHRLAQDVRARVGAAIENASLALDALADEARGATDALAGSRRELESELESVQQAKGPLPGAVTQVRVAAERVGIRWA